MRNLAIIYLFNRFFYRIFEFLKHWYFKSFKYYSNFCLNQFEKLDRYFAWKITFKNLFKPLYGDYSPIGHIIGFFFRSLRFLGGTLVYGSLFFLLVVLYLLWLLLPIFLVSKIFT